MSVLVQFVFALSVVALSSAVLSLCCTISRALPLHMIEPSVVRAPVR